MVKMIEEKEAQGIVKELYGEIRQALGMVPNFFKAQAAEDPEWFRLNWLRWQKIVGSETGLDRKTKELLALAVSLTNRCEYCSVTHEGAARAFGASSGDVTEVKKIVELFASFNAIADSLQVPLDGQSNVS